MDPLGMLDPPYLIDLIELIGSAFPLLVVAPSAFGKSPDLSANALCFMLYLKWPRSLKGLMKQV